LRASGAKRHPGGRSRAGRSSTRGRSRPKGRSGGASAAKGRDAREKKLKLARLKREKAEKLTRLKREKAEKLTRLKREKAEKLARQKRERDEALRRKKKLEQAATLKRKKELEAARLRARREQEILKKKKSREREQREREQKREKAQRDKELAREKALREAERAKEKRVAEQRRVAERHAREEERKRLIAEREAAKEAARRAKEEERARREAEREAYRKAKEAERERLRADREAARRLREGKVARATKAAQRIDGLRVGTTRVYDPSSIPNQSGTTRRVGEFAPPQRLVGVRPGTETPMSGVSAASATPATGTPIVPRQTPPPPPTAATIEQRYRRIVERLATASESLKKEYEETLEMSWIHHDSALEGVVYTFQELRAAMDPTPAAVADSSLQPVCEEIRRHKTAIAYVRDLGERRRVPLNVDVVKKLYVMLHPEEGDVKTVKYRKDIPQHRLYFHEYTAPDKIAYRVRQIMDWLNGPEAKKMKNPLRVAARVHFDLVRVFPFPNDSGKVARLLMNIVLLRGGYPPAIIHSTERQRYYEALKGQLPVIVQLVNESILNALSSIEKRLDDEERQAS
jgi:Fic family protein